MFLAIPSPNNFHPLLTLCLALFYHYLQPWSKQALKLMLNWTQWDSSESVRMNHLKIYSFCSILASLCTAPLFNQAVLNCLARLRLMFRIANFFPWAENVLWDQYDNYSMVFCFHSVCDPCPINLSLPCSHFFLSTTNCCSPHKLLLPTLLHIYTF